MMEEILQFRDSKTLGPLGISIMTEMQDFCTILPLNKLNTS